MLIILKSTVFFIIIYGCSFASESLEIIESDNIEKLTTVDDVLDDSEIYESKNKVLVPPIRNSNGFMSSPIVLWVSAFFSLCALGLGIYNRWYDISENKKNFARSINDDFWFRTIVIPVVLEPIVNFTNLFANKLIALDAAGNSSEYLDYLDEFQKELLIIQSRCILLDIYGQNLYSIIINDSEKFEDKVAEYCHKKSLGESVDVSHSFIFDYLRDVINIIKNHHRDI